MLRGKKEEMKVESTFCDKCKEDMTDRQYYEKDGFSKHAIHWCQRCIDEHILKKKGWVKQ